MPSSPARAAGNDSPRSRWTVPASLLGGLLLAAAAVVATSGFSYGALKQSAANAARVSHTIAVLERLQAVLSGLRDAETGQRGFLLTGTDTYLAPYLEAQAGVPDSLAALRSLVADNGTQRARADALETLANEKLSELRETIALRRSGDTEGALALVRSDRGKLTMDRIRGVFIAMQSEEQALLASRQSEWQSAVATSFRVIALGATTLLVLIGVAGWLLARAHREREGEAWLRAGVAAVAAQVIGERRLDVLGDKVLAQLARFLKAPVGTLHLAEGDDSFRRVAGYAADAMPRFSGSDSVRPGEGLVGQAAKQNQALVVRDIPEGYVEVQSSLGRARARELLVAPVSADGEVHGVIELGFLRAVDRLDRELLGRISESLGIAIRSVRERERVDDLLAETQRQAEELQAQQEELRVTNEELEEQGRALKASQALLEGQQAELEQTNSQLEEQAQILETQKDELIRSQGTLAEKASELERSNRYKSEFLANMSHELRTPLNSTLILAKLLADNRSGNLSPEEVQFARTISSAGNDLLALINDILDLSKIEAGKVEVTAEPLGLVRAVEALTETFEPIARDKGLRFATTIEPGLPERIETDEQRLAQILRNLLSNACKFTERGEVSLRVFAAGADRIGFAVRDSGIGIAPQEQAIIFDAFRQADGSTHRRYGGTGLGLSISRDLARLLGGDIAVQSAPGQGSVFTMTLPYVYQPPVVEAAALGPTTPRGDSSGAPGSIGLPAASPRVTEAPGLPPTAEDDREHLSGGTRHILVIEDDTRFAAILQDLVHEAGLQCIVTHSADAGLAAARKYRPSAILLDMNLPDHSGLGVLDQLKRHPDTRHIPVHIASVDDHSRQARELGAVGYDLKPVKREQIVEALEALKARFAQELRRVLVVEDDARQLESICQLLAADGVHITGVARAAEALAELQATTFDCMVMDLNLPDFTGYELLEKMSALDAVSFPPVIVYTGRMLSRDEELRLGRYSKSIIIKDARSPERLLDEVTLFLHQVEAELPPERQRMLREARSREQALEERRILVVEDDVRNVFALASALEPKGVKVEIARNGKEALAALAASSADPARAIDLVLMDIMMPEMDGYMAMREIRKEPRWRKLPIIALTAKAMKDDHEKCLAAGANDYIAKPLDVEKLLSLVRVWMPK